jgi:hypothetical protein
MSIRQTPDCTHHTSTGECHHFVSFLAKMLFHDKTVISVLTMWNGTHYRPCAQKLGETRITYWNPHLGKELSFDRVNEDWLNTTFTLWTDDINSTNLHTKNRNKCETSHLHSRAVQVFALLGIYMHTLAVGVLMFWDSCRWNPQTVPIKSVTKHKSMTCKHLRRTEASTETTIFICHSQVFHLDLWKHLCCIWCGKLS